VRSTPPKWRGRSRGRAEGCLTRPSAEAVGDARDTQRDNDDTFRGVRLPSATSAQVIVTPVYLADAIRPQGFSPSRRFDPTWTSWLCFAPHPPMGFGPSELFPLGQPRRLSAPVAPLPLGWQPPFRASAPVLLRFEGSKRRRAELPGDGSWDSGGTSDDISRAPSAASRRADVTSGRGILRSAYPERSPGHHTVRSRGLGADSRR